MVGEMFPNRMRGSGQAISGAAQWVANFVVSVSFPALAAGVGLTMIHGFRGFSALLSFFVRVLAYKTRDLELEEMVGWSTLIA